MCGRYSVALPVDELAELLGLMDVPFEYVPRYNAAPGQMIPAVISDGSTRRIGLLRWGLVPSWAANEKIAHKLINAKAETIREKPSFRQSFERKRCLIPADGIYEWRRSGAAKQPFRFVLPKRRLFAMAGLYVTWTKPDGSRLHTCTIITTEPNALMRTVHDRMPVILHARDEEEWLHPDSDPDGLTRLLVPYPAEEMHMYPVAQAVGSASFDHPSCIEPAAAAADVPEQGMLF